VKKKRVYDLEKKRGDLQSKNVEVVEDNLKKVVVVVRGTHTLQRKLFCFLQLQSEKLKRESEEGRRRRR